ncbi:MAG TPA: AzlD domain-containing protein [Terriglobales bacterium]|nr:AzlD domain-containing protein [Terriglobales bacterium]
MSVVTIVAIAAITYGSRAIALVLLPRPSARVDAVLARIPAPIFASLAAAMLLTGEGDVVAGPTLWAALGALVATPARSLLLCLVGGTAGYALGTLFG